MDTPHVLIVDDDESIRFTLSQTLAALPVEIDTAASGEQALEHVAQKKVAVILLDLRMPGMDGMEVLGRLRESRPDIPVIIITAHGSIPCTVEAMRLGAVDFLMKPFLPQEVRSAVVRVLERGKQTDSRIADYAAAFTWAKHCVSRPPRRRGDRALAPRHFHFPRTTGSLQPARSNPRIARARARSSESLSSGLESRRNVRAVAAEHRARDGARCPTPADCLW